MDAVDRRNRLIRWQAGQWQQNQPDNLIVVAGSTGSIKATRDLIAVVASLPNGHVVLPGLDRGAGDLWADMAADSSHPQHALAELLETLDVSPDEVQDWPGLTAASRRHSKPAGNLSVKYFARRQLRRRGNGWATELTCRGGPRWPILKF